MKITSRNLLLAIMLGIWCSPLVGCALVISMDKAPHEAWAQLEAGQPQDLIVVFDDSDIMAHALQLNKAKGIAFDDDDTMRFKAERYAAIKRDALSALPSGEIEILKDYEALPLMFLRFHSAAALKALLAQPSVVKAHEDRQENLMEGVRNFV